MLVTKNIEKLEQSRVKLTVTVSKEDVRSTYDNLIKDYTKTMVMDGFRKGKVPASVLERKFGAQLKMDAMAKIMDDALLAALENETMAPIAYSQPDFDGEPAINLEEDFIFSVNYDVMPEVNVGDISGVQYELPVVSIAKSDENRELEELRDRNALIIDREDSALAKKGDIATVDYSELDENGQAVPGSDRQDFAFEIGSGHNLYDFDKDVEGMKKDEEKVFTKSFPEDYRYSELAGKEKKIRLKLKKLKGKELPALDDELAQDVSEKFKTLDDLKADIRKKLEKQLEDKLKSLKEKAIIEALLERSSIELPLSIIEAELEMRLRNLMQRTGIDDMDRFASVAAMSGRSLDQLKDEWRPDAIKAIKTRFILDKLLEEGKYETNDEELEDAYNKMAEEASQSVEEIKSEYEKHGMQDYLKDRLREDKLLADLEKKMTQKKGKKLAFMDLFKENE